MNKKAIGITAAVVIVIIAIIAVVFMLGKKEPPVVDSPDDLAKTMHEKDPSKSIDEWKDIGNQELTDEQKQVAKEILIDNAVPEIAEITGIDPETNEVTFTDVDGNEWVMEPDQDIINMTDEEANAYTQQILDSLGNDGEDDSRVDFGNNSVNFPSNTQGNPNSQNPGQPQVDTNYEDVEITDGLDWSNSEVGSRPGLDGNYDPDTALWTDPYAGMTPEEKAAAIQEAQEKTQQRINETTGTMHD